MQNLFTWSKDCFDIDTKTQVLQWCITHFQWNPNVTIKAYYTYNFSLNADMD